MNRYETNPEWQCVLLHQEDGVVLSMPMDPANSDYQRYLASLEEDQAQTAII